MLVAGYCTRPNTAEEPVLQDSYEWATIKDHLGGTQIVRDDGHFGDCDQPYPTFDLLDRPTGGKPDDVPRVAVDTGRHR